MISTIPAVVGGLRAAGITLDDGLTESELCRVQDRFGFVFGPEHGALLRAVLPTGPGWVDWRGGAEAELRDRLDRPVNDLLAETSPGSWWPSAWGPRLTDPVEIRAAIRARRSQIPQLVPVYLHRYLPVLPTASPVFSVVGSDIIYYGDDLLDYVGREFGATAHRSSTGGRHRVPFWSDLVDGSG